MVLEAYIERILEVWMGDLSDGCEPPSRRLGLEVGVLRWVGCILR